MSPEVRTSPSSPPKSNQDDSTAPRSKRKSTPACRNKRQSARGPADSATKVNESAPHITCSTRRPASPVLLAAKTDDNGSRGSAPTATSQSAANPTEDKKETRMPTSRRTARPPGPATRSTPRIRSASIVDSNMVEHHIARHGPKLGLDVATVIERPPNPHTTTRWDLRRRRQLFLGRHLSVELIDRGLIQPRRRHARRPLRRKRRSGRILDHLDRLDIDRHAGF